MAMQDKRLQTLWEQVRVHRTLVDSDSDFKVGDRFKLTAENWEFTILIQ